MSASMYVQHMYIMSWIILLPPNTNFTFYMFVSEEPTRRWTCALSWTPLLVPFGREDSFESTRFDVKMVEMTHRGVVMWTHDVTAGRKGGNVSECGEVVSANQHQVSAGDVCSLQHHRSQQSVHWWRLSPFLLPTFHIFRLVTWSKKRDHVGWKSRTFVCSGGKSAHKASFLLLKSERLLHC